VLVQKIITDDIVDKIKRNRISTIEAVCNHSGVVIQKELHNRVFFRKIG
jgi:hypothetical protein